MQKTVAVVLLTAGISASFICPDGKSCPETTTCCLKKHEYQCCPNEKDLKGGTQAVYCDNTYACPDGTTCCRHPAGGWTCCPYSPGSCCLDGYHCCPYGYHCDPTYTRCLKNELPYPFGMHKPAVSNEDSGSSVAKPMTQAQDSCCLSDTAHCPEGILCDKHSISVVSSSQTQMSVILCDEQFFCPNGNTCCKTPAGQWGCCPYPLGTCCKDGQHCCERDYKCDETSTQCRRGYLQVLSVFNKALQR